MRLVVKMRGGKRKRRSKRAQGNRRIADEEGGGTRTKQRGRHRWSFAATRPQPLLSLSSSQLCLCALRSSSIWMPLTWMNVFNYVKVLAMLPRWMIFFNSIWQVPSNLSCVCACVWITVFFQSKFDNNFFGKFCHNFNMENMEKKKNQLGTNISKYYHGFFLNINYKFSFLGYSQWHFLNFANNNLDKTKFSSFNLCLIMHF